jgi:hypothetical protein
LVKLDCRGESDGEAGGAALSDTELESVEHVVQLEEIANPSLEPLLQEVSSEVNRESILHLFQDINKFLPGCIPCHFISIKS